MNNQLYRVQTVVIGAGVVGLAVARELALAGNEVVVLEAGSRFGEGISSRNSEVIHAGIYYPKDSLKARLCVAGREKLYRYCDERNVGASNCGKWIVARGPEVDRLDSIQRQAEDSGVPIERMSGSALGKKLPDVVADEALYSPTTGIVDSHGLMLSLLADLEKAGGQLICQSPVQSLVVEQDGQRLSIGGASPCELLATQVVNAAGLDAVNLASQWQGWPAAMVPEQWFARGVYFSYAGRHPFQSLIYPVPESGGLGVHLTLDLAGQARFGPDVEWIDAPDFSVDPGRARAFADSIHRWWPELDPERLQPAYAGVRPKLSGPDQGFSDFRIDGPSDHEIAGVVQLFGIESPGLTASLAIAEEVRRLLQQ